MIVLHVQWIDSAAQSDCTGCAALLPRPHPIPIASSQFPVMGSSIHLIAFRVRLNLWLWFLAFIHLCCAAKQPLSHLDAKAFERRAQEPEIFIMACTHPYSYFI